VFVTDDPINGIVVVPTPEDLKYLREKLRQSNIEYIDLEKRIVYVIKHNGIVSGCVAARLVWQIEPLFLTPEFERDASPVTLRRAVFKLARSIFGWLIGPENKTGIRWTFAYIEKRKMQKVTKEYGLIPVYRKGKFFAKDF
jgi:hypothetical protein